MAEGEADQDQTIYWTLVGFAGLLQAGAVMLGYWGGTVNAAGGTAWPWWTVGIGAAICAARVEVLADRIKRRTKKPAP